MWADTNSYKPLVLLHACVICFWIAQFVYIHILRFFNVILSAMCHKQWFPTPGVGFTLKNSKIIGASISAFMYLLQSSEADGKADGATANTRL